MKICLDIPKLFCAHRQTRQSNYKKEVLHRDSQVGKSHMKTIQKQKNSQIHNTVSLRSQE
jgi:hypothetical protein